MSFTADELKARELRGEDRTNLEKAARAALPDGADPDDWMEEVDWATTELPMPRPKAHASLRLDADMHDWFKAQGRGLSNPHERGAAQLFPATDAVRG